MKKSILAISVAAAFASVDAGAFTLPDGAVLSIDAGSKFAMGAGAYPADCSGGGTNLLGFKGLFVGSNMGDFSSGSHGGAPVLSDRGAVTEPWLFFCNTGVNYLSQTVASGTFSGDTDPLVGVDMSSWIVGWNNIASIPMGALTIGVSQLTCGVDCTDGDTYVIQHAATVPPGDPSGFGGVRYDVCLMGTITEGPFVNTAPPTAVDDPGFIIGTDILGTLINVRVNDTDPDINDAPDNATIDLDPLTAGIQSSFITPLGGLAAVDPFGGVIYDAPGMGITGMDSFSYTIGDFRGGTGQSNTATVSLVVQDLPPVANDDGVAEGAFVDLVAGETFVNIDVTANDMGIGGVIIPSTVTIVDLPDMGGTATHLTNDGIVLYTPAMGFEGLDTFTYRVTDDNGTDSNLAAVRVRVTSGGTAIGPFLLLKAGNVPDKANRPADGNGSYFTMELAPGDLTYTAVVGFNDIEIGTVQTAASPGPGIDADPNIDETWLFFGNLGVHQTTGPLLQLSNDDAGMVTFDFSVWDVSWNGIPSINLSVGQDNGISTLTCFSDQVGGTVEDCQSDSPTQTGSIFLLTYRAIVPEGDPSGFGGVNYTVHFEGVVSTVPAILGCDVADPATVTDGSVIDDCAASSALTIDPGSTANSVNNTTGLYLSASNIGVKDPLVNPTDGGQCIGGCLDFVVSGIATDRIDLVVRLDAPIPQGAIYRKLINGKWSTFDTSGDNAVGSAPLDAATNNCQSPNGTYRAGLRAGNQCLFITIVDGGPNDADGVVNGTIVDPSGVALAGSPNKPEASTDGCSISKTPVKLIERADWLIVASFIALMGLVSFRRRRQDS